MKKKSVIKHVVVIQCVIRRIIIGNNVYVRYNFSVFFDKRATKIVLSSRTTPYSWIELSIKNIIN